ncbi:MAG TPA: serine hydrolase domain-containing protein [Pseudonocardiaceae bacterium]|jgi:CubicO group peptidase (beta-lactamase class C family)|nr:serine hydrolase domain-containing protein [Pseudonocardiaceae bacterium]
MSWAQDRSEALVAALGGVFDDQVVVAVAAVDRDGSAVARSSGCPAGARFEIGSVTKTMTATLLASAVADGSVALEDPVGRWLDAGTNGDISVGELATHTSGLPRLSPTHRRGVANPYRWFTEELAEQGLRQVRRTTRGRFVYSNFGYQLLGLVLERATDLSYAQLLSERLLGPLGMVDSGLGCRGGGVRLDGHANGRVVEHGDFVLPGPAGVETTIGDLARYLRACLLPPENRLGAAIRMTQQPRARKGPRHQIGLGWIVNESGVLGHDGGTRGFSAMVAVDLTRCRALGLLANTRQTAVAVLQNAARRALRGDDLGRL